MKIPRNIQNQYSESKTKFPKPTPKTTNKKPLYNNKYSLSVNGLLFTIIRA